MPIRPYEITYIIDPDVSEDDFTALVERYRALAEAQGATELRVDTKPSDAARWPMPSSTNASGTM